jgi:hypothetical protein
VAQRKYFCDGQQLASVNAKDAHVGGDRDREVTEEICTDRKRQRASREARGAIRNTPPGAAARSTSVSGAELHARQVRRRSSRRTRRRRWTRRRKSRHVVRAHTIARATAASSSCRETSPADSSSNVPTPRATAEPWRRRLPTCRCRHFARCEAWASVNEKRGARWKSRPWHAATSSNASADTKDTHVRVDREQEATERSTLTESANARVARSKDV